MQIKDFAQKYGLEYYVPYNAMCYFGDIVHHATNIEYEEKEIFDAVMAMYTARERKYLKKAEHYTKLKEHLEKVNKGG